MVNKKIIKKFMKKVVFYNSYFLFWTLDLLLYISPILLYIFTEDKVFNTITSFICLTLFAAPLGTIALLEDWKDIKKTWLWEFEEDG